MAKNATYRTKNTYSKITNVADCKTSKNEIIGCRIPNFNNVQLSNYKIGKLYKSTDGPAG